MIGSAERVILVDLADYVRLTPPGEVWGQRYINRKQGVDVDEDVDDSV